MFIWMKARQLRNKNFKIACYHLFQKYRFFEISIFTVGGYVLLITYFYIGQN
jgi:hypothetical protein